MGIYIIGLIVVSLQIFIIFLIKGNNNSDNNLDKLLSNSEKRLKDDLQTIRKDSRELAQEGRVELGNNLNSFGNSLLKRMHE